MKNKPLHPCGTVYLLPSPAEGLTVVLEDGRGRFYFTWLMRMSKPACKWRYWAGTLSSLIYAEAVRLPVDLWYTCDTFMSGSVDAHVFVYLTLNSGSVCAHFLMQTTVTCWITEVSSSHAVNAAHLLGIFLNNILWGRFNYLTCFMGSGHGSSDEWLIQGCSANSCGVVTGHPRALLPDKHCGSTSCGSTLPPPLSKHCETEWGLAY